jgi:hypothetical protein
MRGLGGVGTANGRGFPERLADANLVYQRRQLPVAFPTAARVS